MDCVLYKYFIYLIKFILALRGRNRGFGQLSDVDRRVSFFKKNSVFLLQINM